jgi:predicted ester cyclase
MRAAEVADRRKKEERTSKEYEQMARTHAAIIEAANASLIVGGNLDAIGDFFTHDYVVHVSGQDLPGGHEVVRKAIRAYRHAFSAIEVEVEVLVTAKNRIAWQRTITAKQTGSFKGFPATKRSTSWRDMIATEFRNGLICEEWVVTDLAEKLLLARK